MEESKIELFKKTYSSIYLQDFSEEKIEEIKLECNSVQQRLIDNLKSEKTYMSSYIEGPTHLYIYKLPNNKTVYLFGETHRNTDQHCNVDYLTFSQYIEELSINSPSFFDLYLELGFETSSSGKTKMDSDMVYAEIINILLKNANLPFFLDHNPILKPIRTQSFETILNHIKNAHIEEEYDYTVNSDVLQSLINSDIGLCFDKSNRTEEECQLFRIHYVNARISMNINYIIENMNYFGLFEFIFENFHEPQVLSYLFKKLDVNNILKSMFFEFENVSESIFNYMITHSKKVSKHYNKSYFKYQIKQLIIDEINKLLSDELLEYIRNIIFNIEDNIELKINKNRLYTLFLNLGVNLMDLYCLSRIFKNYKTNKFRPEQSHNIIVYTGSAHTKVYNRFIKKYIDGEKTYKYKSEKIMWTYTGCIRMPNAKIQFPFWLQNSEKYMEMIENDPESVNDIQVRELSKIDNIDDFNEVISLMEEWSLYYIPDSVFDFIYNKNLTEEEYTSIKSQHPNFDFEGLDILYYRVNDKVAIRNLSMKYKNFKLLGMLEEKIRLN